MEIEKVLKLSQPVTTHDPIHDAESTASFDPTLPDSGQHVVSDGESPLITVASPSNKPSTREKSPERLTAITSNDEHSKPMTIVESAPTDVVSSKSVTTKKKNYYSEEEKLSALRLVAEKKNFGYASVLLRKRGKKYDEKSLREWSLTYKSKFEQYQEEFKMSKRVYAYQPPHEKMEMELLEWIRNQRAKHLPVKRKDIQDKARELYPVPSFKASDGWFNRFKKRCKVSKRLPTHQVQKIKDDSWNSFIDYLESLRTRRIEIEWKKKEPPYSKCVFLNMDEVPLQFDDVGYTYDFVGAKEVSILTTTNSKRRVTLVLTLTSTGHMLAPMLIFKRRTALPSDLLKKFDSLAVLACNSKGWMNTEMMKIWIDKVLNNFRKDASCKYMVVLDKFSAHTCKETKDLLTSSGFETFIIPGGCTGMMQPLDVCFNKPLKERLKKSYLSWLGQRALKAVHKITPPQYDDVATWLIQGLNDMDPELITKSFVYCGK
jgi:hypothetical protein